jgi:Holliday junction resolvase RusA-like endonuclease
MSDSISFTVPGKPVPQGSATVARAGSRSWVRASNDQQLRSWRNAAAAAASDAMAGGELLRSAVALIVTFGFPRPKSHYRSDGTLKPTAPVYHSGRPDADKLLRSLGDSLTDTVVVDDALIAHTTAEKLYIDPPVTRVTVKELR